MHLGGVDVLINNAAIPKRRAVTELRPDEVEDVMRVNFFAAMRMTLALLPRMLARGSGLIVNVSSVGGRLPIIHETAYCASKFALCGWSEAMAVDLHATGVSVKLIEPGPVDTEIWDQPGSEEPIYQGPKVPAAEVADGIIDAMGSEQFEHYVPDMRAVVDAKNADLDGFIAGVAGDGAAMKALVYGVATGAVRGPRGRQPADRESVTNPDRASAGAGSATATSGLGDHPAAADRHLRVGLQADPDGLRRGRRGQRHGRLLFLPAGHGP